MNVNTLIKALTYYASTNECTNNNEQEEIIEAIMDLSALRERMRAIAEWRTDVEFTTMVVVHDAIAAKTYEVYCKLADNWKPYTPSFSAFEHECRKHTELIDITNKQLQFAFEYAEDKYDFFSQELAE